MKRYAFLVFAFLICKTLAAQQVSEKEYAKHLKKVALSKEKGEVLVSLDTVYAAGTAQAILRKVLSADKDYSVKNLSGNELMYFRFNSFNEASHTSNIGSVEKNYYYEVIFPASKKRCEAGFMTVPQLAEFIIKNKLIQNNALNTPAVDSLISVLGNKYSAVQNKPLETFEREGEKTDYTLVERDKTKMVTLQNDKITQDERVVGRILTNTVEEGLITYYLYKIQLPDGTTVATAKHQSLGAEDVEIKTLKDNKIIRITKPEYWIDKAIIQYLVDNGYL